MQNTNEAKEVGKILKKPKSMMLEILSDADAFECTFPTDATPAQKATIVGAAIFINAVHFEGDDGEGGGGD